MTAPELMRQAGMTADTYLRDATRSIDSVFGEGFARAHPELVGAFMQTAASDFMAGWLGGRLDSLTEAVTDIAAGISPQEA